MNKKNITVGLIVIGFICITFPGNILAEEKLAAVSIAPAVSTRGIQNLTGNGYINYETKDVTGLYNSIKSAITKYNGTIKNFNKGISPDQRYININLQVVVDIQNAASFMNDLSEFKEIKNQSYNQYVQTEGNEESLKKELQSQYDRLQKLLISGKADVEVVKILVNNINATESRIRSLESGDYSANKASISINILQKGYQSGTTQKKVSPVNIITISVAVLFFLFGLIARKIFCLRRKEEKGDEKKDEAI